jgi:hypothetical protein
MRKIDAAIDTIIALHKKDIHAWAGIHLGVYAGRQDSLTRTMWMSPGYSQYLSIYEKGFIYLFIYSFLLLLKGGI